ncbi:hypothetical protein CRE_06140 [Caenorhabditis remanei]|uniref:F-box domain-containing protein n=1 Tax=Caenorhabditis remanei TaxID=31234 RepID=E3NEF0_CAERE|nr:hypothetical protein CRE_06140 [Caenorhabditis remanei]
MEPTFPLFRLPDNVIVQVLQNTNLNQLLIISLVSTKSKNFVLLLGLRARYMSISIWHRISSYVYIGNSSFASRFYDDSNDQNKLSVDTTLPVDAFLPFENETIQSSTPFNFRDWLNHIKSVFSCTKPPSIKFYRGCERFEVQSLKDAIGNVDFLYVDSEVPNVYSKEVLKYFNAPNKMTLVKNPFGEACEVQKLFLQNYERIAFRDVCSLDDILLVNCEKVELCHQISQKQFNQFIKHWIRGSNPRLQYMDLSIDNSHSVSREVLLKGIHFIGVAKEDQVEICRNHLIISDNQVKIKRKDGTPAVIAMNEKRDILKVHFIVLY